MPPIPSNPQAQVIDALSALTQQLTKLNTYFEQQKTAAAESRVMGHEDQTAKAVQNETTVSRASRTSRSKTPPPLTLEPSPFKDLYRSGQGGGRIQAMRQALLTYEQQRARPQTTPGAVSSSASLPNHTPGNPLVQARGHKHGFLSDNEAMTWGILGDHAPGPFGRMGMEAWGLSKQLDWAANASRHAGMREWVNSGSRLPDWVPGLGGKSVPGITPTSVGAISGALQLAANNPMKSYFAYKALQGTTHFLGGMNANLSNGANYDYGYGNIGGPLGAMSYFGMRNPLNDFSMAGREGAAIGQGTQALEGRIGGYGFGGGLSQAEAQSTMNAITSQGFSMKPAGIVSTFLSSIPGIGHFLADGANTIFGGGPHGNAMTIAQQFARPLESIFPQGKNGTGLDPQIVAQFDPALRNAGTSIEQLRTALMNLGAESQSTHETINQLSQSILGAGQQFESMGANAGDAYGAATGFTNATGLDPQIISQFAQNPMFQGMMMGQYGILPSGIGDTNGGALAGNMMQTLKMLAGATQGLNVTKTKMVNGVPVVIQNGKTAQYSQIASMTGLPETVVARMLGDQGKITARSNTEEYLGQSTSNTGLYHLINTHASQSKQQSYWNKVIAPSLHKTGLTPSEIKKLNGISSISKRATALQSDLNKVNGRDPFNQIATNPNKQTVEITLGGAAAKFFNLNGPSALKKQAGAGMTSYNAIVNSPTGDLTNMAMFNSLPGI